MTDTAFPRAVLDHWHTTFAGRRVATGGNLALTVGATLDRKRPAMLLMRVDGTAQAVVTPEIADRLAIDDTQALSIDDLHARLSAAGIRLHDPDHLFYLPVDAPAPDRTDTVRRLEAADRDVFDAFHAAASEQDLEDSYVELDHWAVFGRFEGDRLVCAASMYPWGDGRLADLGVLTLPDARGKGHARGVVQAINGFARRSGYEPQYRCQLDNHASVALATACGLIRLGTWMVADGPAEAAG